MSKHKAREHESKCFFNPAVKSCVTCRHNNIKAIFDEEGNCTNIISWCYVMERVPFWNGYPIKHCTGWQGEESEVEHG